MKIMIGIVAGLVVLVGLLAVRALAGSSELAVSEGQPAPDFTLPDQSGRPVTLADQRGRWVVLYFYPKDDTPGCTKEACSFRDNLAALEHLGATVLGVSIDSVASHKEFADKFHLTFPILADADTAVCQKYGVLTHLMGIKLARRSTVIIDPQGVIRKLFPSVQPTDHALEIQRALKDLQSVSG